MGFALAGIPPGHSHLLDIAFSLPRPASQPEAEAMTSGAVSAILATFDADAPGDASSAFKGCLIATNLALDRPDPDSHFYLAPGTHEVELNVGCENGSGDRKVIRLISSQTWEGLDCGLA